MKKVFIASRFEEFKEIRVLLRKELLDCNLIPIDLNDNQAVSAPPISRSLQSIRESDLVVLLIGDSYGTPPKGEKKSYTHLEYDEAIQHKIPIYPFAIGHSYNNNSIQYSNIQNMAEWQQCLENNHTLSMFTPDEDIKLIVHKIVTSVYNIENQTWFDEDTGLMWQVKIDASEEHGRLQWNDIFKYCDSKNLEHFAGFNDWRIPTFEELLTLVTEESHPNSYGYDEESYIKKPLLYSMSMKYGRFWSGTSNPVDNNKAYGVNFNRKRENSKSKNGDKEKFKARYVRCVRLWRYEDIEKEFINIENSNDMDVLINFMKKFSNSKYHHLILEKISAIKKKNQEELESLSPIDKKLFELFPCKTDTPKSTLLYKAIQNGEFNEMMYETLLELRDVMINEKIWKEVSNAKNPEKDKNYQKTLRIINLIQSNEIM